MIRMSVTALGIDPRTLQPIVLLNDEARQQGLPIWIGTHEAKAISQVLQNQKSRRPLPHDLLFDVIQQMDCEVEEISIEPLKSDAYKATIKLVHTDETTGRRTEKFIDARPSDAIVLALKTDATILVEDKIAIQVEERDLQKEDEDFKHFVKDLKASDFNVTGIKATLDEADANEGAESRDEFPPAA